MSAEAIATMDVVAERAAEVLRRMQDKARTTGEERIAIDVALIYLKPTKRLPENVPWPRELRGEAI
jgi:hypothetical protein